MNDFLYLRENNIKEIIELMLEAYTESYSDPYEILKKNSFGRAHHRLICTVNANPGMKVADLIKKLKITKQSLSRVLQELIKEKLFHSPKVRLMVDKDYFILQKKERKLVKKYLVFKKKGYLKRLKNVILKRCLTLKKY